MPSIVSTAPAEPPAVASSKRSDRALRRFLRSQVVDVQQNVQALRPFAVGEFGDGPASPSVSHIRAANALMRELRQRLQWLQQSMTRSAAEGHAQLDSANLQRFLTQKERAGKGIKQVEKIWDFFFELFGQRQTRYADWLLAADRIGLDCYQAVYTGLGAARTIPTPPPFSYMETGFTPATYRRGVSLTRLGRRKNPFPIVKLPYHRLVNPWTLGAIHHEVSHNLQNDLGLWQAVPRRLRHRLKGAGLPDDVVDTWARWHKETWADLCGLLLGGPAIVSSLIGVVARSPRVALGFNPEAVHPTPYLRVLINLELLRRMGFSEEAEDYRRLWQRLYPNAARELPRAIIETFPHANSLVVDTICFQPYEQLGQRGLAEVVRFEPAHQEMVAEAAGRLAAGTDPGIIPARFLVGGVRWALSKQLAPPGDLSRRFYEELRKR